MALTFPRDVFFELFLNGTWRDITSTVRQTEPIKIKRGRGSEQGAVAPGTLTCVLNNASGDYTPGNPLGQWYGKLGRGTPARFGLTAAEDTFTRSVTDAWGTATSGEAWDLNTGNGGTVAASDFQVTGSAGTQSVPTTSAYRYSTLNISLRNVEVTATTTVAVNNISGGPIEPCNVMCRWQDVNTYYMARVSISATEVLTISIHHSTGGELVTPVTVSGLVDASSSKVVRVKLQADGEMLRAKVYAPGAEPVGWHVEVRDTTITAAGKVGMRSGVGAGNSNSKPIVFSTDDLEVRALRLAGEVAELKPRWNTDHSDEWAELTVSTALRRIQQGKTPLKSTLRRGYLADAIGFPVQYWPCEEGRDAQQFRSVIDDRHMSITGNPQFASFNEFLSSEPLPTVNGSTWTGEIDAYTITGEAQLRFLLATPEGGHGGGVDKVLSHIRFAYPATLLHTWELVYKTGGGIQLIIRNSSGAATYTGGSIGVNLNGRLVRLSIEMIQNGGNVDWNLSTYDFKTGEAGGTSGSEAGTLTVPNQVVIAPNGDITDLAIGHIVVQSETTSTFELSSEYNAWRGETPISRADRLCEENGIGFGQRGSSSGNPMGPQLTTTLYGLLQECQDAIQGTLYESRMTGNTVILRTLNGTYNQDAAVTLDYSAEQVAPPLQPAADDRPIRNDVTAKRLEGGEYRISRETGPLNAQDPGTDDGAVGRFDQQVPVNVQTELQLPNVAGWALHLGTVEAERFPSVRVDLAAAGLSSLQGGLLDLDIDDRLVVTGMSAARFYDGLDLIARGYTETFRDQYGHEIEFNCAPYEPYNIAVWSDAGSRWDTAGSSLTNSLTSSATSFSVTIDSGQLWGTAAGNFPLNVWIGGEKVRLSGISGSSSPQTFTVDTGGRAVNGVTKAHDAGTAVRLTPPVYFGR